MRAMFLCALVLAVGCGGGGGTQMAAAQLSGTVYEIDGQRVDLAGVQVTLLETGERTWTDANGAFSFGGLAPGVYRLDFDTGLSALAMEDGPEGDGIDEDGGDDAAEDEFEDDDGDDAGEDEFEDEEGHPKVDVPEGGTVEVDVALEGGKVKDFSSDHEEGQYAMARLHLTDAAEIAGYRVEGEVKIAAIGDHTVFKVCVEGLHAGDVIEVFLREEPPTSIGTATANEDGRACLVIEDSIPLGAPNLGELAGSLVQVFLAESDLKLMVGEVPRFREEHDGEDGEHEGEDEADEPDHDGDGEDGEDEPDGEDGEGEGDGAGEDETPDGSAGEGEGEGAI